MRKWILLIDLLIVVSAFGQANEKSIIVTNIDQTVSVYPVDDTGMIRVTGKEFEKISPEERKRIFSELSEGRPPSTVQGEVIDQNGQPVAGVQVHTYWRETDWMLRSQGFHSNVVTDAQGHFKVKTGQVDSFSIDDVNKPGYEYDHGRQKEIAEAMSKKGFISPPDLMMIYMRKKGETRVLLGKKLGGFQILYPENTVYYDVVERTGCRQEDLSKKIYQNLKYDLLVYAKYYDEQHKWNVIFSATNNEAGLILNDQELYEAPASGYMTSTSLWFDAKYQDVNKYLYVKSRQPSIYARFHIGDISGNNRFIEVGYDVLINPYGDRILEDETDLNPRVKEQLQKEAAKVLSEGRLPPLPDMAKAWAESEVFNKQDEERRAASEARARAETLKYGGKKYIGP